MRLLFVVTLISLDTCRLQPQPRSNRATTLLGPRRAARSCRSGGQQSFADIVDRVAPAVVTIRSERRVRAPQQFPFFNDPMLRDFFGFGRGRQVQPRDEVQRGLGSGVVVSEDGYILTNHHVIDGAQEIKVELSEGKNPNRLS